MNPGGGRRGLLVAVTLVVAAAVVAGLFVLGAPESERQRRLDEVRTHDLMALRSAVADHFARDRRLPASLAELVARSPYPVRVAEPVGGRQYGYAAIDDSTFRLCATFDVATRDGPERFAAESWAHRAGRQCYRFRIGGATEPRAQGQLVPLNEEADDSAP